MTEPIFVYIVMYYINKMIGDLMKIADILILIIIAIAVILVIIKLVKDKISGKCGCSGSCSNCNFNNECHRKKNTEIRK